ncbi:MULTISPECIES: ATP-binding protein [Methanobacterium]|jgi:serine/threonine-protein kinase RsbW|uniref:Histidine kinase/HSP90-like ATPase domain-containing protein n=1 Tax=Methanobacterium formicicum TaxID=2162 RepID=A0A090IB41_METFO|nr:MULTISPECIES: ATP-binding protein [Methanobacterium]KUK74353.1 MAG: Anti-sigma regulatory factor (Ser/Thr protein kinase) [Methanobacterium sp. 42_16]MDG3546437.1 ATP-binding protein [Methanobacterium formicicum]MDH2659613.1 ATP-binding protein [Methanobacterium formicicum]CEA14855.1 hypothetical protein DSM1535_2409 [Methanobacterium formicicum]
MEEKFTLHVMADLKNLSTIGEFITGCASKLGLDRKGVFQLELAVDEVTSNIILHGYPQQSGPIHILIWKEQKKIHIQIQDRGEPFNPLNAGKPDLSTALEERSPGGLGIHFLKTVTDAAYYQFHDGKNILTLVKNLD